MKFRSLSAAVVMLLAVTACSSTKNTTSPSSTSSPDTKSEEIITAPLRATETWHFQAPTQSPYYGINTVEAYDSFLSNKAPKEEVIVAIIDSGTDTEHEDLKANIWVNEDEIPSNGVDDDANGYVDDIYGWNFIGGPDGEHVNKDTYELTRIYARLSDKFEEVNKSDLPESEQKEYDYYREIKSKFNDRVESNNRNLSQVGNILQAISMAKQILNVASIDSLESEDLKSSSSDTQYEAQAKQVFKVLKGDGITEKDIEDTKDYLEHLQGLRDYGLNPDFNPRTIVGDNPDDLTDRIYGNNDVKGPNSDHGTHVAGIVGAVRDNLIGTRGVASPVKLMILRTVPDGDERDKDVANAIRYAADNGARVINMSFGKGYSPDKWYVDEAVRHADSLGVLMVSGAGNGSENIDSTNTYPSKYYAEGDSAIHYLTVGASSWQPDSSLAATFSNYGKRKVDLFAPGVDIYSTYPDNTYKMEDGTSMASPVVAGVAALVMAYYPELSTTEIKEILLSSVTIANQMVLTPGSGELVNFQRLSVTGGIVNALEALKLAEQKVKNR